MEIERPSHSPLIQATIAYASTRAERMACWDAIDTTTHPALPHLVNALRLQQDGEDESARAAMEAALALVSPDDDADLYVTLIVNEARMFSAGKGANGAIQQLRGIEHLLDGVTAVVRMAALWRLAIFYRMAGHLADAFKYILAAQSEATLNGWLYDAALMTADLGSLYIESGDPVKAIACYEESHHLLDGAGDRYRADRILLNLALAHGRVGHVETAERLMEEAVDRQRAAEDNRHLFGGLLNLAVLKKQLNKVEEAQAIYDEMLRRTAAEPPSMDRVRAFIGAASIHNQRGDNSEALELLDQARNLAVKLELDVMVLDIDSKRADVYRDLGQAEAAVDLLQTTFEALQQHTYTQHTIIAGELLEKWLVADGRRNDAYAVLKVYSDLQREVYMKESERALELSAIRQTMEAERRDLRLREEERRNLLQQVLPLPIAERIMAGERRIAEQLDMVGILFADIVGFTQFAAGKSPSEVLESLEALFQEIDKAIGHHGCEKIKTIGDSYMATSGTSSMHISEEPAHAVARLARCGLDMLDLVRRPEHASVDLRVGMHAGPVVAGVMSGMRLAYDMWGDTVNVASRMESTSEKGRFQTTQVVADLLTATNEFLITPRDTITVRGRGQMQTFWIKRAT